MISEIPAAKSHIGYNKSINLMLFIIVYVILLSILIKIACLEARVENHVSDTQLLGYSE